MKSIIFIISLLTSLVLGAQTIDSAEYFFDSDPGVGNGIGLSVNTNSGILTQSYSIDTNSLSEGFHSLYIRTKNLNGSWSLYDRKVIYKKAFFSMPPNIASAEYFIDVDPGVGNGTDITVSTDQAQDLVIDTEGISDGDHIFYIRVQNINGDWSIYDYVGFNIDNNLGIDESLYNLVSFQPNPIIDYVTISTSRDIVINSIRIFDSTGKQVFATNENVRNIDLSNLSSGLHLMEIQAENKKTTIKILKK